MLLNCPDPPASIYKAAGLERDPRCASNKRFRLNFLANILSPPPPTASCFPEIWAQLLDSLKGLNCIQLPRARRQRFKLQPFA